MEQEEMQELFLDLSQKFGNDWKNIGRRLGLDVATLQNIEADCSKQEERAYQTLIKWKEHYGLKDLPARLEGALRKAQRVDLVDEFILPIKRSSEPTVQPGVAGTPPSTASQQCADEKNMIDQLVKFYKKKNKVPLVPWVGKSGKVVTVNLHTVYTRLELLVDVDSPDLPIRYPLKLDNLFKAVKTAISDADVYESQTEPKEDNEKEGEELMQPSRRVVARGRTGSGKSTFLLKLSADWANRTPGPLGDAKAVFLLPLKKLDHLSNLGEAIVDHFCLGQDLTPRFVEEFIENNQSDVVVLLDGYDEFKGKGLDQTNSGNIVKLLRKEYLPDVRLLITTRPGRVTDFMELDDDITDEYRHLEITGFTSSDIDAYVRKVLRERRELAEKLLNYLAENHLKTELASLPLMCCAFCQLTKLTNGKDFKDMNTISTLFDKLVKCLLKYHPRAKAQRQPDKPTSPSHSGTEILREQTNCDDTNDPRHSPTPRAFEHEYSGNDLLLDLGKVALRGFMKSQEEELVFCIKDFLGCKLAPQDIIDHGRRTGILLCDGEAEYRPTRYDEFEINQTEGVDFDVRNISFVLKIFQERFAGKYLAHIANGTDEEKNLFIAYVQGITSLQRAMDLGNVLMFACGGSIGAARVIIQHVIQLLLAEAGSVELFMKGKLHYSECQKIQRQIEFCLQLNYESQSKGVLNDVLKPMLCGCTCIRMVGISSYVTKSLGYFLEYSQTDVSIPVKSLELVRLYLNSSSEFREFLNTFPGLEEDVTNSMSKHRRKKKGPNKEPLTEEKRRELIKGLNEQNRVPKYLLQRTDDTFWTVMPLWEQISNMQRSEWNFGPVINGLKNCPIEELILNGVKAEHDQDWESLFAILSQQESASLEKLTLSMTHINEDLLAEVVPALSSQSNLKYLKLSGNEVGEPFLNALADYPPMENLETLILEKTDMDSESIEQLGDLLHKFPALKTLDIRRNEGSDNVAIESVLDHIHHCKQLQLLMISLHGVTEDGFDKLLAQADIFSQLKELHLVHSPRPNKLIACFSSVLPYMPHLEDLRISSTPPDKTKQQVSYETVSHDVAVKFSEAIIMAPSLGFLSILYVMFGAESFIFLLEQCGIARAENNLHTLRFSSKCIPPDDEARRPIRNAKDSGLLRIWV